MGTVGTPVSLTESQPCDSMPGDCGHGGAPAPRDPYRLAERLSALEARLDSIEDHLAASATDLVQRILAAQGEPDATPSG